MVALAVYRAERHTCGQPLDEATNPENEGRYFVDLPLRCHACTALDVKQQEYGKSSGQPEALLWRVRRI